MLAYEIIVTRADGRLQPVATDHGSFELVFQQALTFAQNAAIHGCPLGDALPPKWVDVRNKEGDLIIRITVDESLKPKRTIFP